MTTLNRCTVCHGMLDFMGIDFRPRRGVWFRWSECRVDRLFFQSNGDGYQYIGKKAPPKGLFQQGGRDD